MEKAQLVLRVMNEQGFIPRGIEEHRLPASTHAQIITQIFRENERKVDCRVEDAGNRNSSDVIARIETKDLSFMLEPLVDNVAVEPPIRSLSQTAASGGFTVPRSSEDRRIFIFLRPDDTINFENDAIKVELVAMTDRNEVDVTAGAANGVDSNDDEIQVKSSNVEPETKEEDDLTDSDIDEDDLDTGSRTPANFPAHLAVSPLPAENELMINETPNHPTAARLRGANEEVYSTASNEQNYLVTDGEDLVIENPTIVADEPDEVIESPTTKRLQRSTDEYQTRASSLLDFHVDATPSTAPENDNELPRPGRRVNTTYGKRGSKLANNVANTSDTLSNEDVLPDTDTVVEEPGDAGDYATSVFNTSDAINETVVRAMRHRAPKRKSEDTGSPAIKKRKTSSSIEGSVQENDDVDDLDATPEQSRPTSADTIKGKLRTSRRSTQQSTESEIAVAVAPRRKSAQPQPNPSPEVIVKIQQDSASPSSSSAASTIGRGKVVKILLSEKSEVGSNASLKKWLKDQGVATIDNVTKRTEFICVVTKDHTLRTPKVLRSLATGKLIVTDDWLTESKKAAELLDPDDFLHDAVKENIKSDRQIFYCKNVLFTDALIKEYGKAWPEIQELAKEAGASHVDKVSFRMGDLATRNEVIFFGSDNGDKDVAQLIEIKRPVYHKDLLVHGIISGGLDLKNFKLSAPEVVKNGRRR